MAARWVKASEVPKIPFTNAHAGATSPIIGIFVHFSWLTFGTVFFVTLGIVILSWKGIGAGWLLQRTKARLRDSKIHCRPVFVRRRMQRLVSMDDLSMQILRSDQ